MKNLSQRYIDSVVNLLEKYFLKELVSVILFGSLTFEKSMSPFSTDVDLMIVVKDSCPSRKFKMMQQSILNLEHKFFNSKYREKFFLFRGLQKATGMFINFFICKETDFRKRKFKIFANNSFMALIAPQNSVWWSLLVQNKVIWGKSLFKEWSTIPIVTRIDIIRSMLMNLLLVLGSMVFVPFYNNSIKYSMEAIKWSLFTWRNYYRHNFQTISMIMNGIIPFSSINQKRALGNFLEYRKKKEANYKFPILALYFVLKLHLDIIFSKSNNP